MVETLKVPTIDMPDPPPEDANASVKRVWQKNIDKFVDRQDQLQENIGTLYSLLKGQCTDIMKQQLESLPVYAKLNEDHDRLGLLIEIKNIAFSFQSQNYLAHLLHNSKQHFYMFQQDKNMTTQSYLKAFTNNLEMIEHSRGTVASHDPGLESMVAAEKGCGTHMTEAQTKEVQAETRERYLATAFLLSADCTRNGKLIEDLENDYLQGRNNYPTTVTSAYHLITNWKQDPRNIMQSLGQVGNVGVSFTTTTEGTNNDSGVTLTNATKSGPGANKAHITCHKCNMKGHYTNEGPTNAPAEPKVGATMHVSGIERDDLDGNGKVNFDFLQHGTTLQLDTNGCLPKSWILLDNQSTVDIF